MYAGVNYFLQDRGRFSHGSKMAHELLEDTTHLAPHGVPSGIGRDLSASKLVRDPSASKLTGDDWNTQQKGPYFRLWPTLAEGRKVVGWWWWWWCGGGCGVVMVAVVVW